MTAASIFTAKVIGTTSIGLWAGYNLSLMHHPHVSAGPSGCLDWKQLKQAIASLNLKALLCHAKEEAAKPEADVGAPWSPPFTATDLLRLSTKALYASALSGIALAANLLAYTQAGTSGKHPYLLYLAWGAPLVGLLQFYGARKLFVQGEVKGSITHAHTDSDEDVEIVGDIGLKPQDKGLSLEGKYSIFSSVVAGLSSFLYVISVVGLAGDASF